MSSGCGLEASPPPKQTSLLVAHWLICPWTGFNQCSLLSCGPGHDCQVDRHLGVATCVCSGNCEPIVRPVCASNGQTFRNVCEMNRQGCQTRKSLTVQYVGSCGELVSGSLPGLRSSSHWLTSVYRFERSLQPQELQPPFCLRRKWGPGLLRVPGVRPELRARVWL